LLRQTLRAVWSKSRSRQSEASALEAIGEKLQAYIACSQSNIRIRISHLLMPQVSRSSNHDYLELAVMFVYHDCKTALCGVEAPGILIPAGKLSRGCRELFAYLKGHVRQ
jgi:hypothetical protein